MSSVVDNNDLFARDMAPKRPLPPFNKPNEVGYRHGPFVLRPAASVKNAGNSSRYLDARCLADIHDTGTDWVKHNGPLPRCVTSEREALGPQLSILGNAINPVIDGLDTALRQTVELFREISSETTQPANDNQDPSEPSQQEAA